MTETSQKAVIYCRVGCTSQQKEQSELERQEQHCRAYAQKQGYETEKVFTDIAVGGSSEAREGLTRLIEFLRSSQHHNYVVLCTDFKRLARDTALLQKLLLEMRQYQANIECTDHTYPNTPENNFREAVTLTTQILRETLTTEEE